MWDADFLKKGQFLGEARLTKQELAKEVPEDGTHEFTVPLGRKPGATDKFNRLVQGSLRVMCQVRARHVTLIQCSMRIVLPEVGLGVG